jgi:hypothetical protein
MNMQAQAAILAALPFCLQYHCVTRGFLPWDAAFLLQHANGDVDAVLAKMRSVRA